MYDGTGDVLYFHLWDYKVIFVGGWVVNRGEREHRLRYNVRTISYQLSYN